MALLKFSVQKLFKLNKIRLNCVRNIPVVTTASNSSNRPINMAYASYETTHSTDYDKTPPIILMHGLFGSKSNWNSLCKAILKKSNPRRKIIAVDARNHGESPHTDSHNYNDLASDIKHLMDRQNIKKACLMGHSMGGKAVMCFALNYPHLVDKLIVVDISPVTSLDGGETQMFFSLMEHVTVEPNVSLSTARRQADFQLARGIKQKDVRAFILTNLIRQSDGHYAWRLNIPTLKSEYKKVFSFPTTANSDFGGDTLFIKGSDSDFIDDSDLPYIQEIFPRARLITIQDAGHWVHSEKPGEFIQIVTSFLNH